MGPLPILYTFVKMDTEPIKVLCIDDSKDIIDPLVLLLTKAGYVAYSACTPALGLSIAKKLSPDLILLDIMMPGMNGYDVCKTLQQDPATAKIPVVFLSALNQPHNKVSALAVGGMDYLTKPLDKESLLATVKRYAGKKTASAEAPRVSVKIAATGAVLSNFTAFKLHVLDTFKPESAASKAVTALQPADVYKLSGLLGITAARVARLVAGFAKRPFFPVINPDDVKKDVLPEKFAVQNNIVAVNAPGELTLLAISNPFNFELLEMVHNLMGGDFEYGITEPSNISALYKLAQEQGADLQKVPGSGGLAIEEAALNRLRASAKSAKNEINEAPIKYLTGKLLQVLVTERIPEMRIEAKDASYTVTAGPAGAAETFCRFSRITGNMVIARLKALGGMDIVERSRPQAGAFSVVFLAENYRLALKTEVGDLGENLVLKPAA